MREFRLLTRYGAFLVIAVTLAAVLSACSLTGLLGGGGPPEDITPEVTPTIPPTAAILAPTLGAEVPNTPTSLPTLTPEGEEGQAEGDTEGGPTPLPEPTEIPTPGEGEPSVDTQTSTGGTGITISPQLGEPLDIIIVKGTGFPPNSTVTLHWAKPKGDTGPVYLELPTDDKGDFQEGIYVPAAKDWPGGPPNEGDEIQLRALSEELDGYVYWANFKYIKRFTQGVTLVQSYQNDDFDYTIQLPNAWTWKWEEDDTSDVRFVSPTSIGKGFILVLNTTNVSSAVNTVMAQEAPGQTFTTGDVSGGQYPGTQAVAANGLTVRFIVQKGQTYAVSFTDDAGNFMQLVADSFRIQ